MRRWWQLKNRDMDLDRELRSDLELEEEEQREKGVPPEEATYAAHRAFGNESLIKEQTREAWGWTWLEQIAQDIRHASRQLGRSPGFTLAVVLSVPVRRMLPFLARDYGKAGMPETRRLSDGTLPLEARRTR